MTKTVMPEVGGDGNAGVWSGRRSREGVKITSTIAAKHHASGRVGISLTEKPRASNSIEQLLSLVN